MSSTDSHSSKFHCVICRREFTEWLLRISVEDTAGFREQAFICGNCAVKVRLSSEKNRDLQIDPWIHEAVASVLACASDERRPDSLAAVARRHRNAELGRILEESDVRGTDDGETLVMDGEYRIALEVDALDIRGNRRRRERRSESQAQIVGRQADKMRLE